ncbi:phytanoyl-CoA dioxygenase family protein [Micromonospora sp. NPDC092111]|uniref:phytanoyl-CoA dioxygenase family protein n=1 Tax=Micromonospora sp. NPDC092111 TaxID=3364289 RepID=UPI00380F0848
MTTQQEQSIQRADVHDVPAILNVLEKDGVVLVPGYLDAEAVAAAARECHELFERTPAWAHHEEYSLGQSVRMERADLDPSAFPVLSDAFGRPELEAVTRGFFGAGYIFSRTVYAILDVVGSSTKVQQLHYDKMRHLKSFVYLSDVGPANGPFHCVPGSHLLTRELQRANRERNVVPSDDDARVLPAELHDQRVAVLGDAGTLILFDSDIVHHAGIVTEGHRLAARSLSFGAYRAQTWYRADGTVQNPA